MILFGFVGEVNHLAANAEVAAFDRAVFFEVVGDLLGSFDRDRKGVAVPGGVDAEDAAFSVDQRAAGEAGVGGRVCPQMAFKMPAPPGAGRAADRADDSETGLRPACRGAA